MTRQQVGPGRWKARARFRDLDGSTRLVERWGATGAAAERTLQAALLGRSDHDRSSTAVMTVSELAADWLAEVRDRGRAARTIEQYERTVRGHVIPRLGKLRVQELTPLVVDQVLRQVRSDVGPAAARTMRSVLSGLASIAVRRDHLRANPCATPLRSQGLHPVARRGR